MSSNNPTGPRGVDDGRGEGVIEPDDHLVDPSLYPISETGTVEVTSLPVLVVEDDLLNARLLAVALEAFDTRIARSAEEAFEMLRTFRPRVIVLDLGLPRMSGLLFVEMLKANPAMRHVAVIALTGFTGPDAERVAKEAGCSLYVSKPFDILAFPKLILAHLEATSEAR